MRLTEGASLVAMTGHPMKATVDSAKWIKITVFCQLCLAAMIISLLVGFSFERGRQLGRPLCERVVERAKSCDFLIGKMMKEPMEIGEQ